MLEPPAPPPARLGVEAVRRLINRPVVSVVAVGLIAAILRFANLGTPPTRVFDEIYYSKSACIYLGYSNARCDTTSSDERFWRTDKNDTEAWVHPPLRHSGRPPSSCWRGWCSCCSGVPCGPSPGDSSWPRRTSASSSHGWRCSTS